MFLNQNFLNIEQLQVINFQLILTRMISPCHAHWSHLVPNIITNDLYSIFSAIRKIWTVARHNLRKDAAQGHQSTSEYTDATSIRNNLLRILIVQINIFGKKKLACYEWEPTKSILAQAKSATYKNLQAGKKQLMRNQKTTL